MAILDMSRWSLLSGAYGIWHDTLITKYGYMHISSSLGGRARCLRSAPTWLREESLLGAKSDDPSDWFRDCVLNRLGSSLLTSF